MPDDPLAQFTDATRAWFEASFPAPTEAQARGWPAIASGAHTLIHAPTGSGKTLAAFLWTLDRLFHQPVPPRPERCRVLYVSPMKALAYDIDRNLRAPLLGIRHASERLGGPAMPELETFLRTGDTPQDERRRMQRQPPDILITTPESLYLILSSQARTVLRSVRWVIVDEVHAIAGSKRGAHLALSLERLEEITETSPQRIGLSATQRPLETIGRFLAGGTPEEGGWTPRPFEIVDAAAPRELDVELVVPVEDMAEPAPPDPLDLEEDVPRPRSIWPAVYPRIVELIRTHDSTIVFANSRRLAERLCAEINELAGEELARAHHGSVSREQRIQIEDSLKRGELKAVVATSSLELGIDMGAVDLVVQVEAPVSVASGLQRVGRAGHSVGAVSRAKVFPKYRGDLLLATVIVDRMVQGRIEETVIPRSPLDVLAQQLVASVVQGPRTVEGLFSMARRAAPYADLSRSVFEAVLDMLAGRYPSDLFAELRPRVTWDRIEGTVSARPGSLQLAVANAGTIPDRGLYRVALPDGTRVGELDEEMVYESRQGDVFILGSTSWRIVEIGPDRVEVIPAPGESSARMPFWHGDALGRSLETGRAVGRFIREMGDLDEEDAVKRLTEDYRLDALAAKNLVAYLAEERQATGALPTDQALVVERFRDEIGDWRLVVLSPLGARVHAPWAMALTQRLRETHGGDVDVIWSDDGMAFRFPDADEVPAGSVVALDPEVVEDLLLDHLADTALFSARFREAAGRALLLPRRRPGKRTPLWLQRRRAADLLGIAKRFGSFPIVLETYREVLQDDFDMPALQTVLADLRSRRIRLVEAETTSPSPFASSLLFAFVAAYLYEGDTPLAERRAAALTLDRELLRELLGEGELREILSVEQIDALEMELQALSDDRKARSADAVHDLLRRLGPLDTVGLEARTADLDLEQVLAALTAMRRLVKVTMGGDDRWAAIEDVSRLRDALGVQPPQGIPGPLLDPVEDPLGDVVARFARTHGPFSAADAAGALGLPVAVVESTLRRLESESRVLPGAFRPGGSGVEWIDQEVLRRLKRRTLASLRSEIEPVGPAALGRFLPRWQQAVGEPAAGRAQLGETVRRIQGAEIPASVLERDVLGTRVRDAATLLDQAMVEGDIIWAGRGSLGPRDGKVALFLRDRFPLLWRPPASPPPSGELHDAVRRCLEQRGAVFFDHLYQVAGGGDPERLLDAVWDLVWAGEVTNDTLAPLRALLDMRNRTGRGRPALTSTFPPHAAGRWSLVDQLTGNPEPTARASAWTEQLLDRHGVVTRSVVTAEGVPGGFSGLYPILDRMEETGRVRRGYFVEGLGGAQFASPGAVDRLRSETEAGVVALAATDPASPYGAALEWPETGEGRIGRIAGAYVVLCDGRLVGFLDGRRLRILDPDPDLRVPVAAAVGDVARRHRRLMIETVDGERVAATAWRHPLAEAGFAPAPRGVRFRG